MIKRPNPLDAVLRTGAQNVGGVKTFEAIPVLPASDPTAANEATRKAYIDDQNLGRGAYSAILFKDGSTYVAEDAVGTTISENANAATVFQAVVNSKKNIFLSEETFDIGSTTITIPDKSLSIIGVGNESIIKGSADPLIDVTQNGEYHFKMKWVGIHTTSSNRGVFIDDCNSRYPFMMDGVDFIPEGHAGTLLYIKGMASGRLSNCSFIETVAAHPTTTAKGIYLTADVNAFSQELFTDGCIFWYLQYGIQAYALPANRPYLAGLHIAGGGLYQVKYPIHFECVDDFSISGITIDSPGGTEEGLIVNDCLSARIIGNRLATTSAVAQIVFKGTALDNYHNSVKGNYIHSYGRVGDGILVDSSPGNKFVECVISCNEFHNLISACQATKGTSWKPQINFGPNHIWDCTNNIKGDIDHSIILGNIWGTGCSSTVVNGTSGTSEIAHNLKT